jgi:hypothetical protein
MQYSPQENIDNDDGSGYFRSHDNFLVYGGNGEKTDFGGHDNHHYGNIYAYAGRAIGVTGTLPGHEDVFASNKVVLTGNGVGNPQCNEPRTKMHDNDYYTPDGTAQECHMALAELQETGMELGSTANTFPADDTIIGWAKELLDIQ